MEAYLGVSEVHVTLAISVDKAGRLRAPEAIRQAEPVVDTAGSTVSVIEHRDRDSTWLWQDRAEIRLSTMR